MNIVLMDILTVLPQNLLAAYFFTKFIDAKRPRLCMALIALGSFLSYMFTGYVVTDITPLRLLLTDGSQLLVIVLMRRRPLIQCFLYYVITLVAMVMAEMPMDLVLMHYYPGFHSIADIAPMYLLVWRTGYLLLFTMGYLIPYVLLQRHYHTLKGDGSIRYVPFLAVQTILLVLPLTILQANMAHFSQWWGMALAYIGANLLLDLLLVQTFRRMSKAHALEQRQQEENAMVQMQMDYYQQFQDNARALRQVRHDMKNQLTALSLLLEQGELDTVREQISAITAALARTGRQGTDNPMVDAVIHSKEAICQEEGIALTVQGRLVGDLGSGEVQLCSIAAMLLDHAIEVCRKVPPEMQPVILLSVVQEQPLILALRYPLSEAMEEETAQLEARLRAGGYSGTVSGTETAGQYEITLTFAPQHPNVALS